MLTAECAANIRAHILMCSKLIKHLHGLLHRQRFFNQYHELFVGEKPGLLGPYRHCTVSYEPA